ncbi:MAG: BON domain-containing protein [Bacteroidetes bacterium]|nr:BON domain-containing protein [Bacteroidota bacterium]MCL5738868.1 BON domain-containing protein [Bacteroidota bacterium]
MRTKRFISLLMALSVLSAFIIVGSSIPAMAQDAKKSDSTVKIFVEYQLAKGGILKNGNINVAVANGKITLTGTVPTIHDQKQAEKLAQNADENYSVVNDLTIAAPYVSDSQITSEVMHRIETHLFYTVFDWVTVHSQNGVVTLKGWVNLPWYSTEYQAQAEHVSGVKKVINEMKTSMGSNYLAFRSARLIYNDPMFMGYAFQQNPPIHIIVNIGSVILEGKVGSATERSYAANLIRFHTDAVEVVNNLVVSGK